MKECNKHLHIFIELIVKAIIYFYNIPIKQGELKRDLLTNLSTNLILSDEVYFLMYNLYSTASTEDLHHLSQIMSNKKLLEN